MYFLSPLFETTGGFRGQSFEFRLNESTSLFVRHVGLSPPGLPAVQLRYSALHLAKPVQLLLRFEHCDFGFVPYYCVNEYEDFELEVYPVLADGNFGAPIVAHRQRLIRLCAEYEEQLSGLPFADAACYLREPESKMQTETEAEAETGARQLELFP